MTTQNIFQTGKNCWRIEPANRVAVLIDGENYFSSLRQALCNAQESIWILAWDLFSRLPLDDQHADTYPTELHKFLISLLDERPQLHVYILLWDFSMLYAFEREWSALVTKRWSAHPRMHFFLDNRHPIAGSQHQKIITVDDRIAFCGGFDLAQSRWDTRAHRAKDRRRSNMDSKLYQPFHDIQLLVDGKAARALAELARYRWEAATATATPPITFSIRDPWPANTAPLFHNQQIAIARTMPIYADRQEIREVEALYLDMIAAAEKYIYIENQYFTSGIISDALAAKLAQADGPEIVMVLPKFTGHFAERITMDVIRARLIQRLQAIDEHQRLRIYYPANTHLPNHQCIKIHSKLMIVDDHWLRIGTANLSNRSMGLDSECDLALAADTDQERQQLNYLRNDLLAEHLGATVNKVSARINKKQSLIAALDSFASKRDKTLLPLQIELPSALIETLPADELIDPPRPPDPERFLNDLHSGNTKKSHKVWLPLLRPLALLALLAGLMAMWRWTPLNEWVDIERLQASIAIIEQHRFSDLILLTGFIVLACCGFPMLALTLTTVFLLGPWRGFACAMLGGLAAAAILFAIGRLSARNILQKFKSARVQTLVDKLHQHAILTTAAVRAIPVAPFLLVCAVAGATRIPWRHYLIGSIIGSLPGTLSLTLFAESIRLSFHNPGFASATFVVVILLMLLLIAWSLRRKMRHYTQ